LGLRSGGNAGTDERAPQNVVKGGMTRQAAGARTAGEAIYIRSTRSIESNSKPETGGYAKRLWAGSIKVPVLGEG
jgi:hypothetical protein